MNHIGGLFVLLILPYLVFGNLRCHDCEYGSGAEDFPTRYICERDGELIIDERMVRKVPCAGSCVKIFRTDDSWTRNATFRYCDKTKVTETFCKKNYYEDGVRQKVLF